MAEDDRDEHEGGGGFMMGLLTGTVLGAGLGMLLAPKRGSELRTQITGQASSLGRRASGAVTDIAERARDSVARGVEQVRGRGGEGHAPADAGAIGSAAGPAAAGTTAGGARRSASTYTGAPTDTAGTARESTERSVSSIDRDRT